MKLAECLAFMRDGDVLMSPSRAGWRHGRLSIEADLSKRGIGLVVLSMGASGAQPDQQLMLTILAGVATVATL